MSGTSWKTNVLNFLDLAARVYLGGVFILAAWGKILDPYNFAISIATYQMMPDQVINVMAIVMPWLELFVGVMLIIGFRTRAQTLLINGMLVMFIIAIIWALAHDLQMQCGCFASEEAEADMSILTVFRDVAWLAIGLFVWVVKTPSLWRLDTLIDRMMLKRTKS